MPSIRPRHVALLVYATLLVSCGGSDASAPTPTPPAIVATVVVSGGSGGVIDKGDSTLLVAEARTASGAVVPGVTFTWTSADQAIATVSSAGWVKGSGDGSTSISATAVGPSSSVTSTVAGAAQVAVHQLVRSVRVTVPDTVATGDTTVGTVAALDRAGNVIPGITFSWRAQDTSMVSLDTAGRMVAKSYGSISLDVVPTGPAAFLPGAGAPHGTARVVVRLVFTQISAGDYHTCGIARGGVVHCWGNDKWGQLGNGIATGLYEPVSSPIVPLTNMRFRSIEGGDGHDGRSGHTCGVGVDGAAYCWGSGAWGMLGDGQHGEGIPVYSNPIPTKVTAVPSVSQTAPGGSHTCLLATDGSAWCAGSNGWGEVGIASTATACPGGGEICVLSFNKVPGGLQFASLVAGGHHNCGLVASGDAWCWGYDITGGPQRVPSPVAVPGGLQFKSLAAGGSNTCGIALDDRTYCWGYTYFGQTGTGIASPTQNFVTTPTPVATAEQFVQVAVGVEQSCGLTADGRTFCWGQNNYGQLGATTSVVCGDPASQGAALSDCSPSPVQVNTAVRFTALTAGFFHVCGLVANGDVYCWGYNDYGQLGGGDAQAKSGLVKVISLR
ncbi:MAG TPA: Ig-like domain-containing protein [Gemmatimonadaceae bacterium]